MWIRLRQIAVACTDLNEVSRDLAGVLGLEACFTDPGVAQFGLKNSLWPIGTQFLECVTPMSSDLGTTAAGRYLSRRGGNTGYMVICEVDDVAARREIIDELGVRVAFELNYPDEGHVGMQLHPADTGGSFLEMDQMTMAGGGEVGGPWWPAGKNWKPYVRTERVNAITAATISSPDPSTLATRWAEITQAAFDLDESNQPILNLDNARIRFVQETDGRGERLSGIDVRYSDIDSIMSSAELLSVRTGDTTVTLAGLEITCVE
ncbi:MAG: VOC family protein, partial [Ilumatobacteraceae bacterium]